MTHAVGLGGVAWWVSLAVAALMLVGFGVASTVHAQGSERLLGAAPEERSDPRFRSDVLAEAARLSDRLRARRADHYVAPVPRRPEFTFLLKDRKTRMVNIDWSTRNATEA